MSLTVNLSHSKGTFGECIEGVIVVVTSAGMDELVWGWRPGEGTAPYGVPPRRRRPACERHEVVSCGGSSERTLMPMSGCLEVGAQGYFKVIYARPQVGY